MKVTVFGGTGYVGGYLIDELLGEGHHPVLLVRPESRNKVRHRERCTLIDGDIASPDSVRAALSGADAAIYNIDILREFPSSGVTNEALHFEGARRAMDAAEEAGARRLPADERQWRKGRRHRVPWASWHIQNGTALHALQELGGWSDIRMAQRYAHLAPEHLSEYADRLCKLREVVATESATYAT